MAVVPDEVAGSRRTVTMPAEVDIANGGEIAEALREAISDGGREVVIDCTALRFIDSTGAAALLTGYRLASSNGVVLRLAHLHDSPLRVLTMLGVIDLFESAREAGGSGL